MKKKKKKTQSNTLPNLKIEITKLVQILVDERTKETKIKEARLYTCIWLPLNCSGPENSDSEDENRERNQQNRMEWNGNEIVEARIPGTEEGDEEARWKWRRKGRVG